MLGILAQWFASHCSFLVSCSSASSLLLISVEDGGTFIWFLSLAYKECLRLLGHPYVRQVLHKTPKGAKKPF